jgi:hypothetical protein
MIKFEVHMNSNILESMINFNVQVTLHETILWKNHFGKYDKPILWTMYSPTFLKPLIFYGKIVNQKHVVVPIRRNFWLNFDIIVIIMFYFWDKYLNVPYNSKWICHQSTKHGLEWNIWA